MMQTGYIHRIFSLSVLLAVAILVSVALPAYAQEVADTEAADAVVAEAVADTLVEASTEAADQAPEWYVAPVIAEKHRAPRKANTKGCPVDSICTFDVDSNLVSVSAYEYNEKDSVICATVWQYEGGKRVGVSKQEFGYDAAGRQNMSAIYEWVSESNSWRGTEKAEYEYETYVDGEEESERVISETVFAWVNNAWAADKRYTHKFDEQNRDTLFTTYARNTSTNELVYSKQLIKKWDESDRQILDVQYTAYSGGAWSAGTKKIWAYDGNGNKTEYTYYSSMANHQFVGNSRELWTYDQDSNKKTKYEKYGWSNGWVGVSKEEWGYTNGQLTMDAKYTWSNNDWVGVSKEEWQYTSGKKTMYATYTWSNGWVGVNKEEWAYESGKDKSYEKFTWSGSWVSFERKDWTYTNKLLTLYEYKKLENSNWVVYEREINEYSGSNKTKNEKYALQNGELAGVSKETWAFTSGKNTQHNTFAWENGAWADSEEEVWEYTSGKETNYEKWAWESDVKTRKEKRTSEYTDGKQTLLVKYTGGETDWVNSEKEVWAYASGKQTLHEKFAGTGTGADAWAYTEKEVWAYDGANQTLHEKYTGNNGNLVGVEKEEWTYTGNPQPNHTAYGWYNSDWAVSAAQTYDANGNQTLVEEYTINAAGTTRKGTKKIEYKFNDAGQMIEQKKYSAWKSTNQWWGTCSETGYDDAGNTIKTCTYSYTNGKWKGTNQCTLTTYTGKNKTDVITQDWNATAWDWVNSSRHTYTYEAGKLMHEATFNWKNEDWADSKRWDYAYVPSGNAAGKTESLYIYKKNGDNWDYNRRTLYTYDDKGDEILSYETTYSDGKWVLYEMKKTEKRYDKANRPTLTATWECGPDSAWAGLVKDTANYADNGDPLFLAHYEGWSNNNWVGKWKVDYAYDSEGRTTLERRFDWDVNAWNGNYYNEYGYDDQGRMNMDAKYSQYSKNTGQWGEGTKNEYVFDENDNTVSSIMSTWNGVKWRQVFRHLYTYDNLGREIEHSAEHFDNNEWGYTDKFEREYKGNALVKNNVYKRLNGEWVYGSRYEEYFDGDKQAKLRRKIEGSWDNGEVISFTDDYYFYNCDAYEFTVKFVNYNGKVLKSYTLQKGETPAYDGETPTRPADEQYTYTFDGWDGNPVPAYSAATYTATYKKTPRKYIITWLNDDDSQIDQTEVEYGKTPTHANATKANTAEWTYTFKGWSPAIVAVTGDASYTASYESAKNKYTITWLNDDNSQIDQSEVEYGVVPTHADAAKANTAEFTYTFAGWNVTPVAVTGEATYKATFTSTTNEYAITFKNGDVELQSSKVAYGEMPTYNGATPEKAADVQYTYAFKGWDAVIVAVTGDATYNAEFSSVKNKYIITWLNDDDTQIDQTEVEYGVVPTHTDAIKANTAEWTYTFAGWDAIPVAVTGDATYKATFSSVKNKYTITWLNDDDSQIDQTEVEYGVVPTHADAAKTNTAEWTYTFAGWDNEPVAVTSNATYKATFSSVKNKYTITWLNDDDSLIDQTEVEYGVVPTHADAAKANTAEWTYTFAGWDATPVAVTGDATYKATFSSVKNKYTITWLNDDDSQIDQTEVEYGVVPTHADAAKANTAEWTYTFTGWDNDPVAVTSNATYKATFSSVKNKYTITWLNDDDSLIDQTEVEYGVVPTHADAAKANTAEWTYTFAGWDATPVAVTGDATYKATFSSVKNKYIITFMNGDEELQSTEIEYGTKPEYVGETPAKPEDEKFTYVFIGWDKELTEVTEDATYYAIFNKDEKLPTAITNTQAGANVQKIIRDNQVLIIRDGKTYTTYGIELR